MTSILDPRFGAPSGSPFPPGTSPFRQKGNGYLGDFPYIDSNVPGGTAGMIASLTPPLRAFFEQRFRGSDWYDAYPCASLHAAAARARGISFAEHRRQVGAFHARATGSLYRALMRVVSNENIAMWGPRVSSIFEFGKTETKLVGPREVHMIRRGVPAGLVQFVVCASQGFTEETLVIAGASKSEVVVRTVEPDGEAHGQSLYRAEVTLRWS